MELLLPKSYIIAPALLHVNIKRTMVLYFIVCIAASDSLDEPEMKRSRSSSIAKEPEGKPDVWTFLDRLIFNVIE